MNNLRLAQEKPCKASDLDGHTELWGWKFSDGGSYGLVTLYSEDDENYFVVDTFDRSWIDDLFLAAAQMLAQSNIKGRPWEQE